LLLTLEQLSQSSSQPVAQPTAWVDSPSMGNEKEAYVP
jgi:hypothetical protein